MRVPATPPQQPQQEHKPKRRLRFKTKFRLVLFAVLLLIIAGGVVAVLSVPKRFNFLVIGSDQRAEERGRSDVLMVVSLTKSPNDPITILTIPRDTRVNVPGFGMQKITHAYALGDSPNDGKNLGNGELTKQTVENFLGIPIDATVEVTFASFEQIIDDLGGVVTESYGELNGEEALAIVRDRFREGGDFARTEDQREILVQLVRTIRAERAFTSVYDSLRESTESRITMPKTRFGFFAAYAILRRFGNLSFDDSHTDVVPGSGQSIYTAEYGKELYYWVPDENATQDLVAEWLS